ncbi:MAG: cold shock domain-containing protein [Thiotrichales bacterium]|nr:cold shock domain-containing protein [Thiotrichales bacterium]
MATNVIGIFGKTCSAKSDVAREISRMTGNKVKHPGEMITTRARMAGLATGREVADKWHRQVDEDTVRAADALADLDELWIIESGMLDAVLGPRDDVFWIALHARDDVRETRWHKRKEEMGGRSRQIGESVAQRDEDDAALRERLYGTAPSGVEPAMTIDTSDRSPTDCAAEILAAFQSETGVVLSVARAEMDKTAARGIVPGPSSGVIRSYTPQRPPFGGYITDATSGKDLYVHKSAVADAGIAGLEAGQRVKYSIVEDGFGGFKASGLAVGE